jgi:hypothetical protein
MGNREAVSETSVFSRDVDTIVSTLEKEEPCPV